jgi:ABC-type Zn uptake system ZnuABC Zn-binding protein ZnuA
MRSLATLKQGIVYNWAVATAVGLALTLSAGCGGEDGYVPGKLPVMATTSVLADLVRQVGGDSVSVLTLLPTAADPHTFEPRPSDVRRISQARLVIANGLGLEEAALKVIAPNLGRGARLIELAEEVADAGFPLVEDDGADDDDEDDHAAGNPHLWLSVKAAGLYVDLIRDALSEADPERGAAYAANAATYRRALAEAGSYLESRAASVPPARRTLVSTHDAFAYLAREIGYRVAAVVAPSSGQEPSAADIADLVTSIRSSGVPAVFREPQLGAEGRLLERAARDAGVRVCILYSDALDGRVKSYLDLVRHNADELARCLGQ